MSDAMDDPNKSEQIERENPDLLTDEEIIAEVVAGQTNLFSILIQRYNQRLFRIVRGYLRHEQDVKDVMQSAYLKAFENLKQFRGEAQFSTWLIRIAIHEALKKINRQKNISDLNDVTDRRNGDQNNRAETSDPEEKIIQKDMNRHLEKAIDTLPPKYRSVLIMREIEQMSTEETAQTLEISRANVKVRLHRAKKMLRDELTDMLDEMDLYHFRDEDCDQMTNQVMSLIRHS
jgi:RNA polymerase sigma-70 factor (ECF subfamily)